MLGILEYADVIEVLARRNVAQRECLADHVVGRLAHAVHALEIDVAQTALEQLGRQRRGAGALEVLQGFGWEGPWRSNVGAIGCGGRYDSAIAMAGVDAGGMRGLALE